MRRRRLVRRRFLTGCFIMLLFVTILTGRSMLTTMAEEEPVTVSHITGVWRSKRETVCEYSPSVQEGEPYVYRRIR